MAEGALLRRLAKLLPRPARAALKRAILPPSRMSLEPALRVIRDAGVAPRTVIDVGAAYGAWSADCQHVFPAARYLLIEPLAEYSRSPDCRIGELRDAVEIRAAATGSGGSAEVKVDASLVGSTLLSEQEVDYSNWQRRTVPAVTLNQVVAEYGGVPPYLVKVDVQGGELDVLAGGDRVLPDAAAVFLEVSFFGLFIGGPQFHEVLEFMRGAGFVVYDFLNPLYRPLDGALAQADVIFVPEAGPLRQRHVYATEPQRRRIAEELRPRL